MKRLVASASIVILEPKSLFYYKLQGAQQMNLVVYGTLKRGLSNHGFLLGARCVGKDILHSIVLYDLGDFPGAQFEPSLGIHVEVYDVTDSELAVVDRLEECNEEMPDHGLFRREQCNTSFGPAWIYLYNGPLGGLPQITTGSWRPAVCIS